MTDTRWKRLDELFERLVDLSPTEQVRILDTECADDLDLRREVEGLVAADAGGAERLSGLVDGAIDHLHASTTTRVGDRVGPYTLRSVLGQGGMGTVYLAEPTDAPYDAKVAVKVLRGTVGSDAAERLRVERQILATLDHPAIALLIDGGETALGQPYLVMEHVEGQRIDEYCASRHADIAERLRLFRTVCAAVQYAHGRLVVHRDLKPANVLVGADGTPRLLDFGIAKLLEPGAGDARRTRTGVRPMTPSYASPEQVRGTGISTATDVYALGVLLYELLTGALPYPLEGADARSIEDAILTHEPSAPSSVLRAGSPTAAAPTSRSRLLGTDLDTIVLKALEKDPDRRYESVEELSEDVLRLLEGRPIEARPTTWTYRTGKFVRRNRGAVLGGVVTALSLLFFGVSSGLQALQLERQRDAAQAARDEAQAVTSFLVDVFGATDPNQAQGLDVTARDILGSARERVRSDFADRPAVQGAVMTAIGRAYQRLGSHDLAVELMVESVDRAVEAHGEGSLEHANALRNLGSVLGGSGR